MVAAAGMGAVSAAVTAAIKFFAASQILLNEPWPPVTKVANGSSFDFIIVGGGTAGAALAARLSQVSTFTVLLVEAGGDPPQESIIPGFRDVMKGSKYDWNFTMINEYASRAIGGGKQRQPRGKMLGGTDSFGDMVYSRGFPKDYNEWASIVGDEWRWTNVLRYFKRTEHCSDEKFLDEPELMARHGRGGPIEVTGFKESTFETDKFMEAFMELGYPQVKDMTSPDMIGVGRFSHTIKNGRRNSTATAMLNKAANRKNLFVMKDALVTELLTTGDMVVGVKLVSSDEEVRYYANKEVIVSAGTFNTPKLLLLSGIGPKKHLEELKIPLLQDLPVGENLQDHAMVLKYITVDNGTCFTDNATNHMNIIRYFYNRTGPLSRTNSMGAYLALHGSTERNIPDFAFYPSCMPVGTAFKEGCLSVLGFNDTICTKLTNLNAKSELITIAVVYLTPKSRGNVRLSSRNPEAAPIIRANTFSDAEDLKGFPEAMEVVKSLAGTAYFKSKNAKVVDLKIQECKDLVGEDLMKCQARETAMSAWHSVGTAALGSVVDEKLKVIGVRGLRVVDASVMPRVIRGNTNAAVIMIAEKAFDFIKTEYGLC